MTTEAEICTPLLTLFVNDGGPVSVSLALHEIIAKNQDIHFGACRRLDEVFIALTVARRAMKTILSWLVIREWPCPERASLPIYPNPLEAAVFIW